MQALDLHNGYLGRWCYWKREHVFFTLPEQAVNKVLLWSYSQQCTHLTGAATATVYTLAVHFCTLAGAATATCCTLAGAATTAVYTLGWSSYSPVYTGTVYTCWSSYSHSVHLLEQLQLQCTLAGGATAAVYTCWSCIHLLGQCTHLLEQLQPEVYTCWDFTGDYPFRLTVWFACCLLIGPA